MRLPTGSKIVFSSLMVGLSFAVLLGVACSPGGSPGAVESDKAGERGDMDLVWEAWDALVNNYAAPEALDESAVAGGAIYRILELGDLEPYPFLAEVGRMRGRCLKMFRTDWWTSGGPPSSIAQTTPGPWTMK